MSQIPSDWLERPEVLVGRVVSGRYRVTALLGRGPMGIAYEAESSRGRQVTLKLLPRPPEVAVERFIWQVREAVALAHFDHGNVSAFSDFGTLEDGNAFVSRARVQGVTLRSLLRQGALAPRRAIDVGSQIAAALAAAHAADVRHGRLKPENIVIQSGGSSGDLVKVVDFGLAELRVHLRAAAPTEADARAFALRTRMYQPPRELAPSAEAQDVYALGVVLFEMIAGHPPFAYEMIGPDGPEGTPLEFAECNPPIDVPKAVSDLVQSTLRPHAAERGITAQNLCLTLNALLGRPSVAPPLNPPELITTQLQLEPSLESVGRRTHEPAQPTERSPEPPRAASQGSGNAWPTLPPGFASSSFPPPPGSERPNASSMPPPPPSRASSFPPPIATMSSEPSIAPPAPFGSSAMPAPRAPSPDITDAAELEAEEVFRPSLLARLRRLFKRNPSGF